MNFPDTLKYSEDHEWILVEDGNEAKVGITDFAQSELGELVYIEVETIGEELKQGEIFGTVEAVKTTSDLYMPVSGTVLEFNPTLDSQKEDKPEVINEDPYENGWIIKIKMSDLSEADGLMNAEEYKKSL